MITSGAGISCLRHFRIKPPIIRKEWPTVRRILLLLVVLMTAAAVVSAQGEAVGVVVVLQNDAVSTLDVSFPADSTMEAIQADMQQISTRTGWHVSAQPAEARADAVSVHAEVTGAAVGSILDDVVWPIVAAMSSQGKLGIVVMGGSVAAAPLIIENRFVRLEQRGGQGVQSYVADIKDTSFQNLEELKQPGASPAARSARGSGSRLALGWILVIIASIAVGVFVYFIMRQTASRRR